ncbi:hypothetical protein GLOTRDRAFT_104803 [Gloeophyllum trabeum ATCC 11539]|uniref:Autophagy-related protein 27 n=1 Tax=Gloeophyllum trabeum (strain ATCC 11539 / FP-39264 / Madison 617) TaxID=670483 RepID=S7RVE6_GLOTA|nr:uncharacterized protein GLOTRDRAFT_104803 [Gloeophyllum trabeum ATCC 11539]EPQ57219.1 hypothetical protein GLOTRDRAFT_104803 [Gloeophyllum trabeum ATCC 11539]
MVSRRRQVQPFSPVSAIFLALSVLVLSAGAQDDCSIDRNGVKYDLTALKGEHTVSRTRDTPPSKMVDSVRFDLCGELQQQKDVAEADQCPSGTRACLTKINQREGQPDRIVAVIPLAQTSGNREISPLSSPEGLSITFDGPSYPPSSDNSIPQSFNLTLLCSKETSDITFTSYEAGQLKLSWSAPAGCGHEAGEEPPKDEEGEKKPAESGETRMGSGIGWFFLVLLLALAAYFGLGAYYNYSTYGATGSDLIPHRDFWREVPYMLRDVVSHLCSAVRPRHSSRGGYIAV